MEIKRTERGWAGHFIGGSHCAFRRNTLLESDTQKIIVSTVGILRWPHAPKVIESLGYNNRYYETMAFEAKVEGVYTDIDVSKEIYFESKWAIDHYDKDGYEGSDNEANDMHEAVVSELTAKMQLGEVKVSSY